ncbi:MAG: hypothetical protein LBT09_10820 [Planctomycetaceae bacterium]|jgi:hypothetical protein|nr:hypothetical protein [Planctomycetaceae bacterium]
MIKSFFAFCLVAVASFVLFTNAAVAQDKSEKVKVVKVPAAAPVEVTADDGAVVVHGKRHSHFRHFGKVRLPRFEFPEFKLPKFRCALVQADEVEVVEDEVAECDCGKVVYERTVSHAGYVKNVKYVKLPHRFLLKRIVKVGKDVDVEP